MRQPHAVRPPKAAATQDCRVALILAARFLAMLVIAPTVPAAGQTTGSIVGRVASEDGAVLAGVRVEAQSESLQGSRTAATDASGAYRLTLLPPGLYAVTFSREGFGTETQTEVVVGLDRDTTLDLVLRPTTVGEITVVSETPALDPTSTTLGTNLSQKHIRALPSGRNYSSLVQVTPGVSSDAHPENTGQSSITVYGSTGAENVFIIDGVNTTGAEYGFQGKELNFEFIQELDVKSGGYEAEHGKSTGGVINVITKSGGNEFHGDIFGYFDDDSLQSSPDPIVSTAGQVEGFTRQDFGADLGGYIVKDRLWFFAAYDQVINDTDSILLAGPQAGEIATSESERDLAAAKLTLQLSPGQSLIGSFFQDPRDDTGAINDPQHTLNGEELTFLGRREFGGRDYALRYEGIFGDAWVVSAQASRHQEENSVGPASAAGDVVQFRDVANDFFQTGGFGLIQSKDFDRTALGASAARYLGEHEIKLGVEVEDQEADVVRRMSGGQQVDIFANPLDPDRPVYRHFYWTTPDATLDDAPLSQLEASPEHQNTAVFLQDRWRARPNLTVNLGVRWDRQEIIDAAGTGQIDLRDVAPRLGIIWDPGAEGRHKVFASYGRYYEQLPMDLVIRSFSFERQPRIFNFDPFGTAPDRAAEAALGIESAILGGFTEPSDPDLAGQYINEIIAGYERQVAPVLAVGIKGIYRDFGEVIEDFLCMDDGTYCIGNPARGIMREIFTYDYSRTLPAPEAKRIYRGVQLDATRQFRDGWQGIASYIFSELEGNFDGLYAPFTNIGPDPNITAAYDYYDFFTDGRNLDVITNRGPLSNDRKHQFKASGIWRTPVDLLVGVTAYYRTGTPLTRYGFSDGYGRYEFFLTRRGAEGRTPDNYEADLHLGYPVAAGPVTINLLLDVFNVLNAQKAVLLDQRWGFQEADNISPVPVNPGYGQPVLRTPPTSFRLGVRVSF